MSYEGEIGSKSCSDEGEARRPGLHSPTLHARTGETSRAQQSSMALGCGRVLVPDFYQFCMDFNQFCTDFLLPPVVGGCPPPYPRFFPEIYPDLRNTW